MRRGWSTLCLLVGFAGCLFGPTYYRAWDRSAEWVEPGLFERLPRSGHLGGFEIVTNEFGTSMLHVPELDEAWGAENYGLSYVSWSYHPDPRPTDPVCYGGQPPQTLSFNGSLTGEFSEQTPAEDVRKWVRAFLVNVTSADGNELEALAQRFYDNRAWTYAEGDYEVMFDTGNGPETRHCRPTTYHSNVNVPLPDRLRNLYDRLRAGGPEPSPTLSDGNWTMDFALASKTATGSKDAALLRLDISLFDVAKFEREFSHQAASRPQNLPDADMGRLLNETFEGLGQERPSLTDWRFEHRSTHAD